MDFIALSSPVHHQPSPSGSPDGRVVPGRIVAAVVLLASPDDGKRMKKRMRKRKRKGREAEDPFQQKLMKRRRALGGEGR